MADVPKAVLDIAGDQVQLLRTVAALVEDWRPEPVPMNTAMGAIGRALVKEANPSREDVSRIFAQVEAIFRDGTEEEKDAIATGFLEAVVSAIDRNPAFQWVIDAAGPEARAYVDEWNRFCGL